MLRWALLTAKAGHSCTGQSVENALQRIFPAWRAVYGKKDVPSPKQPGIALDHLCPTGVLIRFRQMCHHGANKSVLTPFG